MDYMQLDDEKRVLDGRRKILQPLLYYLTKAPFDKDLKYIIASYPPSAGKSITLTYFSAWAYGLNKNNAIIRMSYSDDLVASFSRTIREIVASPKFAEVFTEYKQYSGNPFVTKEVGNWKLKDSKVQASHIAVSRDGQITGKRANFAMIFDDMTKGVQEATNAEIHRHYYNQWNTEWFNRKDNDNVKYIFIGTMWSPEDILNRVREDREKLSPLIPVKGMKYVEETTDKSTIVIRVPLIDEETDTSICEAVMSTKEALALRDNTDPYLWSCVYQQKPIPATGLSFAYDNLKHFSELPLDENREPLYSNYCLASLDTTRRGKDNASMPIFKVDNKGENYYMVDCIFKKKAITELYDEIIAKIEQWNITELVIENNTDTSLKNLLDKMLEDRGIYTCIIKEKYNTPKKEKRIKDAEGLICRLLNFKEKTMYAKNSDYGRLIDNLTTYSFDYPNKNDDAPDSLALFVNEIILEKNKPSKPVAISRRLLGI